MTKITTPEMECALAAFFDSRVNLIVPNVHWGLEMHECDLLMVSKAGYCTEIEIKISRADLKNDAKKRHGYYSNRIKYLYFAIPTYLEHCIEFVPARASIVTVRPGTHTEKIGSRTYTWSPRCKIIRRPQPNKATKMTDAERYKVARLGPLRIWLLKRKLITLQHQ